ncbi:MAG: DUF2138 domain-containing protein [Pseudomonas sp.]|uniref:DUF2138 domain-containing protein n=1 Tax=Pseudomonas sp. TaxID=306 RepID=UPI0033970564
MSENTATPGAAQGSTRPRWRGALLAAGVLGVGLASAAGLFYSGAFTPEVPRELAESSELQLDLGRPDALIESQSLSGLPKDLLSVPLLRDSLTEDLVFYYEANPDRLGLAGSLRRIIYEHDLQLQDSLLDELLDQPAQVALWRGEDGKLKHFLLLLDRGGLARLLEPLARVAASDTQLSEVASLQVDGDVVPLYRLNYNGRQSLLLASHGDKLLVLSSPGMLLQSQWDGTLPGREAIARVEALLDGDSPFAERFGLESDSALRQRITLSSDFLALGYQRFIPTFAGLRFEMDGQGWHSFLALNDSEERSSLAFAPVWQAMPMGASACVALPVATRLPKDLLVKVGVEDAAASALTEHLSGAAGLCWYPESRLHSPLLVGQLDESVGSGQDQQLGALFESLIGAQEVQERAPVETQTLGQAQRWQRTVSSNFGQYPGSEPGRGFFKISLARHGATLLFSLDDTLVGKALDTLDKRFPPLADVLPKDALVPLYLAPDTLAKLFEQETLDSLPTDMEPVFRNAAQTLLLPKLKALAGHGRYALTLPADAEADGSWSWQPLQWKPL